MRHSRRRPRNAGAQIDDEIRLVAFAIADHFGLNESPAMAHSRQQRGLGRP